jgi:YVTN family beta-propeller protein
MEHGEPVGGTVNVLLIDPRSWTIVERIPVGKGSAFGVPLTPDRTYAVVDIGEENALAVIDTGSRKVVRKISTGKVPCDVHIDPAGARVFVPERDQDTVAAIDLATAKVAARVSFHKGSRPHMLRVSPAGRYVRVQTEHASTNEILDAQSLKIVSRLPLGKAPSTSAFSPNGRYALITHFDDTCANALAVMTCQH